MKNLINFIILLSTAYAMSATTTEIIAHRGAAHYAPENTLASFNLAWEKNADGIEGDFRLTKDNKIVCMHDPTTKRTTGVNLIIKESTYEQLRALDAGSSKGKEWKGEKIPLLSEILEIIPDGKKLYLEVKCGIEIIPFLKRLFAEKNIPSEKVVIISFNSDVIAESKKQMSKIKALWLCGISEKDGCLSPSINEIISNLKKINADGLDVNAHPLINKNFVNALKSNNFSFCVWTVDDPKVAEKFEKLGAKAITTNIPDLLKKTTDN